MMLAYKITAESKIGGEAIVEANHSKIEFDASAGRLDQLPNPAELLLSSLAACMLKNVERYSKILKFEYTQAKIEVNGVRNDSPPMMSTINYVLKVATDIDEKKLNLLHKNILKFGTITNTLAQATELHGVIKFLDKK